MKNVACLRVIKGKITKAGKNVAILGQNFKKRHKTLRARQERRTTNAAVRQLAAR